MTEMSAPTLPCPAEPFLPHAAPMALIDRILSWSPGHVEAAVTIRSASPFCGEQGVPVWVGVEYMAQAIAAYGGLRECLQGEPVKIGFLVSTRRLECVVDFFARGQKLRIIADEVHMQPGGLAVFDCAIQGEQSQLASARINVFQPLDPLAFLRGEVTP